MHVPSDAQAARVPGLDRAPGAAALGSPGFSLVSSRAGMGLDRAERGFALALEGHCVPSALRTEFHGLCQCQTCEVQFFSWDSSVIVDSGDAGESSRTVSWRTWEAGERGAKSPALKEQGVWVRRKSSHFNCEKPCNLCRAGFQ